MRLGACIGMLLFSASACAALPDSVRIDVDGRVIELRQQGLSGRFEGGWSTSPECGAEPRFDVAELGEAVTTIRMITPDELELVAQDGRLIRLHRCQ